MRLLLQTLHYARTIPTTQTRSIARSKYTSLGSSPPLIRSIMSTSSNKANQAPSHFTLQTTYATASNYAIPALGYGVYQTPSEVCAEVVAHALKTGYRHIDSARAYRNEVPCTAAMQAFGIPRDQIFFTTKISPGQHQMGYEQARDQIDASLKATGLGYVDLFLIHAPYGGKDGRCGTWRALVEAQKAGKVKNIGVSNYGVHHLDELKEYAETSGVGGKIDVGQWELHPWLPRKDIVEWCRREGLVIEAWSPLVRGQRADEQVLKEIADKHSKTWAQVLIRWSLQMGFVPLPKSVTPGRIEDNANVYDFELDADDMKALDFPDSYAPCSWDPTTSRD